MNPGGYERRESLFPPIGAQLAPDLYGALSHVRSGSERFASGSALCHWLIPRPGGAWFRRVA
jgi:hypothetical protein